jgi:hypothetical protein
MFKAIAVYRQPADKAAMQTTEMMGSGKDAIKFAGDLLSVNFVEDVIFKVMNILP